MEGLIEGAILAVLVVLLFLRDIRATLISAVAIPLSAIPSFFFMSLMGITMNFMSTMAMGLVAGVLVDDAIVEIENIVRHMRMGKSGYQAALDAADEIGLAVLATTMAIVAVFFPVALMPGVAGQYFKAFGFTVVFSVLMSLFVARMITPLISAYFLRSHGAQPHAAWKWMDLYLKVLNWSLDTSKTHALLARIPKAPVRFGYYGIIALFVLLIAAAFMGGTAGTMMLLGKAASWGGAVNLVLGLLVGTAVAYGATNLIGFLVPRISTHSFASWQGIVAARWNARLQDHRLVMVAAGAATLLLSVVLFGTLSNSFFPPQNSDYSRANIVMAPGSTLKDTEQVVDHVAAAISKDPNVDRVFERINVGEGHVNIVLKKKRDVTSTEFERNLSPTLAAMPDARVSFQSQQGGGPDADSRDIMLYLGGEDPAQLEAVAQKIAKEMQTVPGLRAPRVGSNLAQPEITIKPRFDLAADLGVTTSALSQTIRIATLGEIEQNSAKFSLSDRQVPIQVSLSENDRRDLSTLQNLPVPTSNGGSVPLKAVADIGFGSGPTTINRSNQLRRLAIGADLAPGVVEGDVWEKINALPTVKNLPQGIQKMNLGNQKWQAELMFNFAVALISGILLVFAVLVLLYRRFLAPFVNMGSLILAPLGAAIALHIANQPVSLFVLIGILMLFGIVAKNSILLVDFAVEMMNHGMPKDQAIWEAGHKRAQPIVMTTIAMVFGMLPTAISITGDNSWRAPMGITVIGGLIFSTVLTLLLVPAYFSIAISIEIPGRQAVPSLHRRGSALHGDPGSSGMMDLSPGSAIEPGMRAMANGALTRFNPAQPGAQGMKVVATGLLVVMAAVFAVTRALELQYPALTYVKAFAEAAMVGGLADWFAVTALFRHPLGLPIPHTAIIPRNKDRIGESLANFIRENFLIPSVVARRMQRLDVAGAAGRFLQTPAGEGNRIRAGASRLIADIFESLDDERLGGIVKGAISARLRKTRCRPCSGTRWRRRSMRTVTCRCWKRRSAGRQGRSTRTSR